MDPELKKHEKWKQAYHSVTEFGRATLTSAALLNGGAAAAIIAATTANSSTIEILELKEAIYYFAKGAGAALLALGVAYWSEYCLLLSLKDDKEHRYLIFWERLSRSVATASGFASVAFFLLGIDFAYNVLKVLPSTN